MHNRFLACDDAPVFVVVCEAVVLLLLVVVVLKLLLAIAVDIVIAVAICRWIGCAWTCTGHLAKRGRGRWLLVIVAVLTAANTVAVVVIVGRRRPRCCCFHHNPLEPTIESGVNIEEGGKRGGGRMPMGRGQNVYRSLRDI